jgi:hypothetical protein
MALKDVNVASQLNQVFYGTVGRCPSLQTPTPSPSSSDADVCLPETGTLALVEQFQCQTEEQYADELASASQAAAMLGGTLAAALLVYSLLPYVRARNRKRRRSRSRTHSQTNNDILRRCEDQQQRPSTPTTPNGASRRMWGSLEGDGIEPAGARRDERRERKSRQPEANGSAVSDAGSELLLAKLPDFNGERCWGVLQRWTFDLILCVLCRRTRLARLLRLADLSQRAGRRASLTNKNLFGCQES